MSGMTEEELAEAEERQRQIYEATRAKRDREYEAWRVKNRPTPAEKAEQENRAAEEMRKRLERIRGHQETRAAAEAALPVCNRCSERKVMCSPATPGPAGVVDGRHLCEPCYFGCPECGRPWAPGVDRGGLCHECRVIGRFRQQVPAKLREATMAQVRAAQPAAVVEVLDQFLRDMPQGLVMSGPPGTGKSFAAVALLRELIDSGHRRPSAFTTAADMLEALRPSRDGIERFTDCDVLVLDDVGRERLEKDWPAETFFMIVDRRWRCGRTTIVTTNLAPSFVPSRIGDAVWDRLRDGALGVRFAGQSMRQMAS